jgi:hypothetical protein
MATENKETTPVVKEKKVKIRIPLERGNTEDVFVSVNDRSWLIQRGKEVEVPECVVEVLDNQAIALEKAYAFNSNASK